MIVKSAEARQKVFLGIAFDVLAAGKHTMVTRMRYESGAQIPGHHHPNEQAGYVISGRVRIRFGEYDEILEAGDTYVIPKDVVHTFDVFEAGEVLDVFCPPREDYLG